ncbi:ankyrin repeat domain-containing protein [Limibacter armeniacum]|uniref:ankyrin repeat domain-containing protein n=1 Tax=Limibacter armeniacum TaxID=466084 RepID=UPI002FE51AFC
MKKAIYGFCAALICAPLFLQAQSKNVFLDRNYWSETPSIEEVKNSIEEGYDPLELNNRSFNGTTYAILNNMPTETIEFLLSLEGNDINTITHDGRNYLHWAANKDNLELVKYLVDHNINTGLVDDHGYSVLNFAATTGKQNPEMYDYLLAHGSKITETNHDGANSLLLLIPHLKDFAMVDYFISKGLDLDSKDKDGNGAFYYAAKTGNTEMMDILIEKGVKYTNSNAMIAASKGTRRSSNPLSVFEYLEKKGLQANVVTKEGETPLHLLAGKAKDTDVIRYFIGKGVDVNKQDKDGNTALINAAGRNNLKVVSFIVEKSKDINASNKDGETALTNAVKGNKGEVVSYLISKGAEVNHKDKEGNNVGFYLIQSYRPNNKGAFNEKLELLQKNGFDPKAKQAKGNTLFHLAAEINDLNLLKAVQALGVDVNQTNDEGTTPLQIAAMKATDDVILKYLIKIGADTKVKTAFEETVYDLANENELLQAKGVNITFLK